MLAIPYTGSGVAACVRCWDKVLAKHLLRAAGIPTPKLHAFSETAFRELGAAQALPAIEAQLAFPLVVKPAAQGRRWGSSSRAHAGDVPAALVSAFSYDRKVLLERYVPGRDLAVSIVEQGGAPHALPIVEAVPTSGTSTTSRRGTRSVARGSCAPRSCRRGGGGRRSWRSRRTGRSGCAGFARVDLMLHEEGGLFVLEVNGGPRADRDEPAAAGRRRGGHRVRHAGRARPRAGASPA